MADKLVREGQSSSPSFSGALHPLVYKTMVGIALWLVVAAWGFLTGTGYILVMLGVLTWLVLFVVVLTLALARIGRRHRIRTGEEASANRTSFRDWARGELGLRGGRTKASTATIEIFVPLAAAAIAMTLFAVVRVVVVG
jgi:small-conductance mechanosensitive channel